MSLQAITIPPANSQPPKGLIVILHGWGANRLDLAPLAEELNLPDYQFLCPDAPFPHPQVPGGKMWYDLQTEDYEGLPESQQILTDWLESQESATGVPLSRTILSGFSQGGAMTLDVGLRLPLAGLVSLSGYLHGEPQPATNPLPPVLIVHGSSDTVVPLRAAHQARDVLVSLGVQVQYQEYRMSHEIIPEEMELIRRFVLNVMSKASSRTVENLNF